MDITERRGKNNKRLSNLKKKSFFLTPDQQKIVDEFKTEISVETYSELIRRALICLAHKENSELVNIPNFEVLMLESDSNARFKEQTL
ncbi:MAG: hypothetical protein HC907_22050 [Richelia sp. SM1_7_0]|nr:hypothetical protein [Richelia sp. SM1_7_0]